MTHPKRIKEHSATPAHRVNSSTMLSWRCKIHISKQKQATAIVEAHTRAIAAFIYREQSPFSPSPLRSSNKDFGGLSLACASFLCLR